MSIKKLLITSGLILSINFAPIPAEAQVFGYLPSPNSTAKAYIPPSARTKAKASYPKKAKSSYHKKHYKKTKARKYRAYQSRRYR